MEAPLYLVTGAAGFVGRHLVEHLVSRGDRVLAMVRKAADAEALREVTPDVVIADLQDPKTLAGAVDGVAGIYHVAAVFRQSNLSDETFYDINAKGVQNILDAAISAGVQRFVHCSTNGVHSDIDHPPADETYPFNPGDIYQRSKLEGEQIAMRYFEEGRIAGVTLRPTMIYGPGDSRTLKLFRMIADKRFFYVGPGTALVHWVDVRDLAGAFRLAMQATDRTNEAYLIGGRAYLPLREMAQEIARQLGVSEPSLHLPVRPVMLLAHATELVCKPFGIDPPLFRRRVAFFLKNRAYDISKARAHLGYEARQDLAGEITDIIADYRARGDLPLAQTRGGNAAGSIHKQGGSE